MRIAICGGTFDPFHRGHLEPLVALRAGMEWDRIIYVPARRQPFKLDRESTSGYHRFAMGVLATEALPGIDVSPWELDREVVSYSVDTLGALRARYPRASLEWVIGDDNLDHLDQWKSVDRIFEVANFIVLARGGGAVPDRFAPRLRAVAGRPENGALVVAGNDPVPVSATEIRERVRAGLPIETLVDPRVARYIQHNGLYRNGMKGTS